MPANRTTRLTHRAARSPRSAIDHWTMAAQPTFVYAIREFAVRDYTRDEPTGYIKIGVAHDPERRVAELQTGNPRFLSLAAVIYGTAKTERILHSHFVDAKIDETEWFDPGYSDAIVALFKEIDWRQRTCRSLDHDYLTDTIVRDVLSGRPVE